MSERFSGKGNPAYVDGLGLERGRKRNQQRNTLEYRLWRSSVFHRDGYTCVMCGGVEALQADHIEGWAVAQQKRYDVENGRTLCAECHRRVTWGGALRTL
jgi:5-methylcytosine-specific restriction endonuclease McrA